MINKSINEFNNDKQQTISSLQLENLKFQSERVKILILKKKTLF